MKSRTEGRRYSKRRITTPESWADLDALATAEGGSLGDSWETLRERLVAAAGQLLEAAGLPCSPWLALAPDGGSRPIETPRAADRSVGEGVVRLDAYVDRLGHARDSAPWLAARIVTAVHAADDGQSDPRIAAFELGRWAALMGVYGIESSGARQSADRSAEYRRRVTEHSYAEIREKYLAAMRPGLRKKDLYQQIGQEPQNVRRAFSWIGSKVPRPPKK